MRETLIFQGFPICLCTKLFDLVLNIEKLLTTNVNNTYIAFIVLFGINMSGGEFQKSVVTRLPQQKGERYVQENYV